MHLLHRLPTLARVSALVVAAAFLAGCGAAASAGQAGSPPPAGEQSVQEVDVVTIETRLVGLSLDDARSQAEMWGLPLRVSRLDDETFALPEDHRVGRITVEADTIDGVARVTSLSVESPTDAGA